MAISDSENVKGFVNAKGFVNKENADAVKEQLFFNEKPVQSYITSASLSQVVDVATFVEEEIIYLKATMIGLQERVILGRYKYWHTLLEKRIKELTKRRRLSTERAASKRKIEANEPLERLSRGFTQMLRAQNRKKPVGSGRISRSAELKARMPFNPDLYETLTPEQKRANIRELHKDDEEARNYFIKMIDLAESKNISETEASAIITSTAMLPSNYTGPKTGNEVDYTKVLVDGTSALNEDGTPWDLLKILEYNNSTRENYGKSQYWCNTEDEQKYADEMYALEHGTEEYKEEYMRKRDAHFEAERLKREEREAEFERVQAIKRKADKILLDLKAKEDVKCLSEKKLNVDAESVA
jgi:hypothetical protein